MAALDITVLKNNAPWGPFTRAQIEDGLARGDFTVKYLAHAPGLKEWLPLGEVLDYVERGEGPRMTSLPPVPGSRELPPIPERAPSQPPIIPASIPPAPEQPAPPLPPVVEKREIKPEAKPEVRLRTASFFLRGFAFVIDCAILFVPVAILFALGALAIEIPAATWNHISHQARMEEWELLKQNMRRLAWLVAVGFGWLYGAGLESSPSQATVGKRWMGIKVTDAQGERMSFLRATGRYAAKYLSALPCFLGFIMALFSSRGLALHDRLADTRVVDSH
jgi:uncharacterized RDD family membrane protein YckC